MTDTKSQDESPKEAIAKKVVTKKRRYFFPRHGKSVEANSIEEAEKSLDDQTKQDKDGDV